MGGVESSNQDISTIVSNNANDFNPFGIPIITLESSSDFGMGTAMKGCPPLHSYTRATFASLPIETKAAYADGVVRGSYTKQWLKEQYVELLNMGNQFYTEPNVGSSAIGALAYMCLKEDNPELTQILNGWCEANKDNQTSF